MAYRTWEVTEKDGRFYVFEVNPKKRRGFAECYPFPTREKAEAFSKDRRAKDEARRAEQAARRSERSAARAGIENPFKVGDLFAHSWGYDQTNVNFYQVVAVTPRTVTIREIAVETVAGSQGFMSSDVRPKKGEFLDKARPMRKTLQAMLKPDGSVEKVFISMEFGWASPIGETESRHETHYG